MKGLGITDDTPDPEGGVFYKENGKLTGYAEENAYINNVQRAPMPSTEDIMKAVIAAQDDYASFGITTMQEGMIVPALADFLAYIANANMLKLDYIGFVDIREKDKILPKMQGCIKEYKNHFKVGGFKTFLDGSPQGRTAYMRTDYLGEEKGYRAYPVMGEEELEKIIETALKEDMQLLAHCNGDAAVAQYLEQCIKEYKNHFKVGGFKTFLDGSPQARTAFMRTDYLGEEKGYKAYPAMSGEELEGLIEIALKEDMQLLAHCNGDAAVAQYLEQYKIAKDKLNSTNDIRPVIIHAQLIGVDQLPEVKKLGMIPSFFIAHVYHWGDIHVNNFGFDRASQISPAKSALDEGIKFTFHQDAPVIEPNMIETMWIAVNRKMKDGTVLGENQKIPALAALEAVTKNGAYQ